jgi:hypothetical protein
MVAGLVPLRFTHEQIRYAPNYVEDTLRAVAARLRRQRLDDSPALAGQIVR